VIRIIVFDVDNAFALAYAMMIGQIAAVLWMGIKHLLVGKPGPARWQLARKLARLYPFVLILGVLAYGIQLSAISNLHPNPVAQALILISYYALMFLETSWCLALYAAGFFFMRDLSRRLRCRTLIPLSAVVFGACVAMAMLTLLYWALLFLFQFEILLPSFHFPGAHALWTSPTFGTLTRCFGIGGFAAMLLYWTWTYLAVRRIRNHVGAITPSPRPQNPDLATSPSCTPKTNH
jgi:hypothetical protein